MADESLQDSADARDIEVIEALLVGPTESSDSESDDSTEIVESVPKRHFGRASISIPVSY